jgi:UrcA family protein
MLKTALTAVLALTGTITSFAVTVQPSHAREDMTVTAPVHSERVPYQFSELASEQGIRGLQSRVRQAAHHVCEPDDEMFATYSELSCFSPTFRDGLAQIDRAVALARSGALAQAGTVRVGSAR